MRCHVCACGGNAQMMCVIMIRFSSCAHARGIPSAALFSHCTRAASPKEQASPELYIHEDVMKRISIGAAAACTALLLVVGCGSSSHNNGTGGTGGNNKSDSGTDGGLDTGNVVDTG